MMPGDTLNRKSEAQDNSTSDPKRFWEFLISRHPIEEERAPSTKRAYRWRKIPALHLVVGQYVSVHGVGVYVSAALNPSELPPRETPPRRRAGRPRMASNSIIHMMKREGIPLTVENYRFFNWNGTPPDEMSAEEAASLPPELTDEER
jgi:hypothetical protein